MPFHDLFSIIPRVPPLPNICSLLIQSSEEIGKGDSSCHHGQFSGETTTGVLVMAASWMWALQRLLGVIQGKAGPVGQNLVSWTSSLLLQFSSFLG